MRARGLLAVLCMTVSGYAQGILPQAVGMYCLPCHNPQLAENGVQLDPVRAREPQKDRATFERVLRELRARAMPPADNPRPDEKTYQAMVRELAAALDGDAPPVRIENDLRKPEVLGAFFDAWLGLDGLAAMPADAKVFPELDAGLREAMKRETELFVESQVREDRPAIELWTAKYTFVNERLASLYGIAGVSGPEFRRVSLEGTERAGLLGQASMLTLTSVLTKHEAVDGPSTSPAARARWIRTHFLDIPLREPLPNPSPMLKNVLLSEQLRTIPDPSCEACHKNFLPLGYALENFDELGRWRTEFKGLEIDVSGETAAGEEFEGPAGLLTVLLDRRDAFYNAIAEEMLAYAIGGRAEMGKATPPERMPVVRAVLREAEKGGYRWSALTMAIASLGR